MGRFTLHFYFLSVLHSVSSAIPSATIYGPNYGKSLFDELKLSFTLSHPYNINYVAITQATENITAHLNAGDPVLVNTLEANPNGSVVLPMFGFPITVVHSVPVFSLNLSQSVLVDIFTGKIRWWNHTNLTDLNSGLPEQPIKVIVGSLLSRVYDAMSVFANRTITVNDLGSNSLNVAALVCPTVKATPYSIGFAWFGDALAQNSQLASVVNKDGFLVDPSIGVAPAMSEYALLQRQSPGVKVQPHNMRGQFSWPMISFLYMVLPPNFKDCEKLIVVQNFLSLVMFQTQNMDLLCEVLGWEPAKALTLYGSTLGKVTAVQDSRDVLFSLPCGTKENLDFYSVGTSSQLATFLLKLLAPYTGEIDPNIRLLSADSGINEYLDAMVQGTYKSVEIDMSFTWQPLLKNYPQLLSVPVFMGSVVPWINLPGLSIVLDQPTLVGIFTGEINVWNDAKIQALNPGVSLPTQNISVYAAAEGALDGPTIAFKNWLTAGVPSFSWSQVEATTFTPTENDVSLYVDYFPYSIGYGFGHDVVNASRQVPRLVGSGGQSVAFSSDSLSACWLSLDNSKCWPPAIPLVMVLQQPTDCARQKHSVDFVEWTLKRGVGIDQFLVTNLNPDVKMGAAEYCNGRSLIKTEPEPQTLTPGVKDAIQALAGIGMMLSVIQAIALGVARKRSELKSASVVFSLLAVVGAFVILIAPLLIMQDDVTVVECGSAVWMLCLGFSLCFGSIFCKLFRLYTIFTSRKLVVPRLSNKKLLIMVSVFIAIDVVLLIAYSAVTPPYPYVFSTFVPSSEDLVTHQRMLTLTMCSFHVDSPVLYIIFIYKCFVAAGGAVMAFFIRQVDRRFSATAALGLCFWNLFITVIIAIIITVQFSNDSILENALTVPMFCGLWIMYVTLCALTLDSNVLLACKDFSQPLRRFLASSGKTSKDSKDRTVNSGSGKKGSAIGDLEEVDAAANKRSHSSTIFVVNREMFPSKYDDFDQELLDKILQELNFQRAAVRRAINPGVTGTGADTAIELSSINNGDRRRGSTRTDLPAARLNSKGKPGPTPLSLEVSGGTSSPIDTPRMANGMLKEMLPEPVAKSWSNSITENTQESSSVQEPSEIQRDKPED